MTDVFLKEQLELLRKLNDRVSKIQDDVNHNVELIAQNAREAERWRREERIYQERNAANDLRARHEYGRRMSDRRTQAADDHHRHAEHRAVKRSRIHGKHGRST